MFAIVFVGASHESYMYQLFFERSWIQYATTFVFFLALALTMFLHRELLREHAALARGATILESSPECSPPLIWSDADAIARVFAKTEEEAHEGSLTFSRIRTAMERLRNTKSTKALEDYFRNRSDLDVGALETSYSGIRYLIWLLPTLGFIGTVMGIGRGISGFAEVIAGASGFEEVKQSLPTVTSNLGTAFDTTLLALGYSAIAGFYVALVVKKNEDLVAQIDHLCFDRVCSLFLEQSGESDKIVEAVDDAVQTIVERMNGNRGLLEAVITQQLPLLLPAAANEWAQENTDLEASLAKLLRSASSLDETAKDVSENVQKVAERVDPKVPSTRHEPR